MSGTHSQTRALAEGAVIVALTIVLRDFLPPIYRLPQGGSVSAAGMVHYSGSRSEEVHAPGWKLVASTV